MHVANKGRLVEPTHRLARSALQARINVAVHRTGPGAVLADTSGQEHA
jgi:hypothetical protein